MENLTRGIDAKSRVTLNFKLHLLLSKGRPELNNQIVCQNLRPLNRFAAGKLPILT